MAHFAKLDQNNVVLEVCVVNNAVVTVNGAESEAAGVAFLKTVTGHDSWKQTSYNSTFRKNYASKDYVYDDVRDAFIPPKPFDSWVLDEATCMWGAPTSCPADGNVYAWDESLLGWSQVAV